MSTKQENKQTLPTCITEYLTRIIQKMRYRKKVCREVMHELTGHLEDELCECESMQEKDKRAQDLMTEFGDAKMLAVLMRRAKKRCRPLWKKAMIRSVQAGVLLLGLSVCYVGSLFLGKPTIRTDYLAMLNQTSRPEPTDADNAWHHYERAAQLYQQPNERLSTLIRKGVGLIRDLPRYTTLPKSQQAYIAACARKNQAYWEKFDQELRTLLRKYFEQGLVPYRIDPYSLQSPEQLAVGNEHWVLDSVIRNMVVRSRLVSDESYAPALLMYMDVFRDLIGSEPIDLPLATDDARLEFIAEIVEPLVPLSFDASDEHDRVFWRWLQHNELPDSYNEGLAAGMLRYWMEHEPQTADGLFAAVNPFAEQALASWFTHNEMAWKEFVAGSKQPYCYREYTNVDPNSTWLIGISTPGLNSLRNLGRLGKWKSQLSLTREDTASALDSSLTVIRAGRHIQGAPTIIEQLVGDALNGNGHEQLLRIVSAAKLSGTQLQQLNRKLTALYPDGYPIIDPELETLTFHDTVQHVFTDGGLGGGHIVPQQFSSLWDNGR